MKNRETVYREHEPLPEEDTPSVASANECTGLMFTPPESGAELEAYQELSPMAIPRSDQPPRKCPGKNRPRKKL